MTKQGDKTWETTRQGIVPRGAIDHGNDMRSSTSRLAIIGTQLLILLFGFAARGVALASFGS